jgi:hypothetical protein
MTGTLREDQYTFHFRRSLHHSTIHKVKPRKCNNVSKFYTKLKMFRAKPAHHQEPKTALAASGFSYAKGCCTCRWWTLSGTVCA